MRLLETGIGMTAAMILLLLLYFLPGIIAWLYRRERLYSIFLLDLLAGWTVLGWFAALNLATTRDTRALEDIAPLPRHRAKNRLLAFAAAVALCLTIQAVRIYGFNPHQPAMASGKPPAIDPNTVSITRYALHRESSSLKGEFTIRNQNSFKVKDVVIRCVHATINATVLDSTTVTVQRTFQPHRDQNITDFDLGSIPRETANSSCSTQGFAPAE